MRLAAHLTRTCKTHSVSTADIARLAGTASSRARLVAAPSAAEVLQLLPSSSSPSPTAAAMHTLLALWNA